MDTTPILTNIADYYSLKLSEHGATPLGVDWNGADSQTLRFKQLSKIITTRDKFSLIDLGCGYGALFDFLKSNYNEFTYTGIDISESMIKTAKERFNYDQQANFVVSFEPSEADYILASGIFNVRLGYDDHSWRQYLLSTLDAINSKSKLGFAFNCLTSYSDNEKMRDYLYYANPCDVFDICKRHYSRHVALLHDYGLYEFTILVRKQ
ncbi:trans-aconitate 2-methyltransferase [Legionella quinlivanii]|uniref:Trans-aconitate 2-methyltransferase n=1 Tax=Legionella quinlivanii TaxID=45073 RepID=A0A0W0Y5P6_9GAMM|nr:MULTISPECIES: class I SAM-dependent methyltransferase [Legionella]KTD51956.1 trans-aconitate 2-methyltransferase [Legionella quinlivanii]MCE3046347.1 class I SAM-dependent methyltransferase [Legionella sp. 16cNR16C]MCW8452216.1 class I SAM-dependent methyltransferase [Legionella quinlivanii]SEF85801.1 Methyltransferase domain-containing protein [Legionella quinlivanii DSM 21216]STY09581.1 trans-aconitate 2-methyltransferase [Legionella quinlivanii]